MAAIVFLKFLGPHLTMFNSLSIMRYIRQRLRKVVRRFRGFGRNSMKPGIHTQQGPIYYKDPILSKRTKAKTLINIINLLYHIRYYIHMVETKTINHVELMLPMLWGLR